MTTPRTYRDTANLYRRVIALACNADRRKFHHRTIADLEDLAADAEASDRNAEAAEVGAADRNRAVLAAIRHASRMGG